MNNGLSVPFGLGFQDGITPGAVMACALFLGARAWLERRGMQPQKYVGQLLASVFIFCFASHLGLFDEIFLSRSFDIVSLAALAVEAFLCIGLGAVFVYDWALGIKGRDPQSLFSRRIFAGDNATRSTRGIVFMFVAVALLITVAMAIWPPSFYVTLKSNEIFVPGRLWSGLFFLLAYTATQMWLIFFFAALASWSKLNPRLRHVIYAAVFIAAGASALNFLGGIV